MSSQTSEKATHSAFQALPSRSCIDTMPSSSTPADDRTSRARVSRCSLRSGLRLWGGNATAGQSLLLACVTDGTMRNDFPFVRSFDERGTRLAGDVRTLATVAEDGSCVAAKDVSMAGILGSLAMLVECNGLGATVDLDALPVPKGVDLHTWLIAFPCFAFLLCAPPGREDDCARPFQERGIEAVVVGTLDESGEVAVVADGRRATVIDVGTEIVTGLGQRR